MALCNKTQICIHTLGGGGFIWIPEIVKLNYNIDKAVQASKAVLNSGQELCVGSPGLTCVSQ